MATKLKGLFSFQSDTYHVHKATEEELQEGAVQSAVDKRVAPFRPAPKPPTGIGLVGGGVGGSGSSENVLYSIVQKPSDKKLSKQRKVGKFNSFSDANVPLR